MRMVSHLARAAFTTISIFPAAEGASEMARVRVTADAEQHFRDIRPPAAMLTLIAARN